VHRCRRQGPAAQGVSGGQQSLSPRRLGRAGAVELYNPIQQIHEAMWRPAYPKIQLA